MARRRNAAAGGANIWPGFVDALATLLLVIIFLLVVFVLAQVLLSQAISGKDEALERLNRQVAELAELLDLERDANADLRLNIAQVSSSLQSAVADRDELLIRFDSLQRESDATKSALADVQAILSENREKFRLKLLEIASLQEDITQLRKLREQLEGEVAELATALKTNKQELIKALALIQQQQVKLEASEDSLGAFRDRSKRLAAQLAEERERTRLTQLDVDVRDIRLSELDERYAALEEQFDKEVRLTTKQQRQIALLNAQIAALRREIGALSVALEASEAEDKKQQAVIKDLGRRLNKALASKVAELARYRSEFFGRLRKLLGARKEVRIVGDRFVFQSEVLFASGSAELGEEGKAQLGRLARTLLIISVQIPRDINWILRVDGHTDRRPIKTALFPSNWQLSTARAISVVRFLIDEGVPAVRLAATGFGEFQPLDPGDNPDANRRNRRIELKLTQR